VPFSLGTLCEPKKWCACDFSLYRLFTEFSSPLSQKSFWCVLRKRVFNVPISPFCVFHLFETSSVLGKGRHKLSPVRFGGQTRLLQAKWKAYSILKRAQCCSGFGCEQHCCKQIGFRLETVVLSSFAFCVWVLLKSPQFFPWCCCGRNIRTENETKRLRVSCPAEERVTKGMAV